MAIIVQKDLCIGCGACVSICPVGAIALNDGKAEISDACIACGACISDCPVKCICREETARQPKINTAEYKDIWVYIECQEQTPKNVSYELITAAKELAAASGEHCCALVLGKLQPEYIEQIIAQGADKIYYLGSQEYNDYNTEMYTQVITAAVNEYKPNALLIGATVDGRDLAPRVAGRLGTGLCADCTSITTAKDDPRLIEWTRPAFGGNIMATIVCPHHRPQMGSVRPKVLPIGSADPTRKGEIIHISEPTLSDILVEVLDNFTDDTIAKCNIQDADIICAGGRGMGSQEEFNKLYELAKLLGGQVAGSRAVVESGWLDHSAQVGQSGVTVGPKVYFAFGISGAIQHLAGMTSSDIIIAVNKNANAPIFKVANYGIVGDIKEILPALINKIKDYKSAN